MTNRLLVSAPATPTASCGALLRPAAPVGLVGLALDANDWKDQYGPDRLDRSEFFG